MELSRPFVWRISTVRVVVKNDFHRSNPKGFDRIGTELEQLPIKTSRALISEFANCAESHVKLMEIESPDTKSSRRTTLGGGRTVATVHAALTTTLLYASSVRATSNNVSTCLCAEAADIYVGARFLCIGCYKITPFSMLSLSKRQKKKERRRQKHMRCLCKKYLTFTRGR